METNKVKEILTGIWPNQALVIHKMSKEGGDRVFRIRLSDGKWIVEHNKSEGWTEICTVEEKV